MCPVNVIGRPGIVMLHMCVDLTLLPSGRLMVNGVVAGRKYLTAVPSIMNMDVAPISVIASVVAMVIACRYWFVCTPHICRAVAAKLGQCDGMLCVVLPVVEQFDIVIVTSSLVFLSST